jgi:hypothetical protein
LSKKLGNLDVTKLVKADPFTLPAWRKVLMMNDPGAFTTVNGVPLLMIQGGNDEQIPVPSTELLAQHLCKLGQDLDSRAAPTPIRTSRRARPASRPPGARAEMRGRAPSATMTR